MNRFINTLQNVLIVLSILTLAYSCYNDDNKIIPTCQDGVMNQEETGVDCGGPCPDCPPTCNNGILDWDEELGWFEVGIDCGGPCETNCCDNGRWDINEHDETLSEMWVDCKDPDATTGEVSSNSECEPCDLCTNGVHDADNGEFYLLSGTMVPAIDCGGPNCPDCLEAATVPNPETGETMCQDGLLNGLEGPCGADCGGLCPPCDDSHCENGVLDTYPEDPQRSETSIDCGGCECPPCVDLCGDGIQNGAELAPDCGGPDCPNCFDMILCGDGIQNGYETGIDCFDDPTPNDPTDNSPCPSCATVCTDGLQNGFETDTDCGGDDCQPCNDESRFLTYKVDGVLYESWHTTLGAGRLEATPPATLDLISFNGGANHPMTFQLKDQNDNAGNFVNSGTFIASNQDLDPIVNTVSFTDIDGVVYTAESHSVGLTIEITTCQFTPPAPPPNTTPGGLLEGTFSGTLQAIDGTTVEITEGMFRMNFGN